MTPIHRCRAFAMIDALMALLLFALVVLAAIGALLQGMRATQAAVPTGHAVDLAADLLEQQRALPAGAAPAALRSTWDERLQQELPPASRSVAQALVQPLLSATEATP